MSSRGWSYLNLVQCHERPTLCFCLKLSLNLKQSSARYIRTVSDRLARDVQVHFLTLGEAEIVH
jgi:hypothetical protein